MPLAAKLTTRTTSHILLCLSLIPFTLVQAENESTSNRNTGLVIKWQSSPFVGGKDQYTPRPIFLRQNEFNIRGPAWSFNQQEQQQGYIGLGFDDWDYQRGKSPALQDMQTLQRALNIRLGGAWKAAHGTISAEIMQAFNAHKAQQIRARYTFNAKPHNIMIRPYAEIQWQSAQMTDYYIGVKHSEAQAARPTYQADSAWVFKTGIEARYPINKLLTLVAGVEAKTYSSAITDSPIIDETHNLDAYLGLTYRW